MWINDPEKIRASRFYKKLEGNFELLERNRQLVRLRCDMPEELSGLLPDMLIPGEPDWAEIAAICRDNQFNSILKELPELPAEQPQSTEDDDSEMDLFAFANLQSEKADKGEPEKESAPDNAPTQLELF